MVRSLLGAAALLVPALAGAEQPAADLAKEIARLKQQVAKLSARAAGAGLKIGVVDIVRVFDELEEKIDMNAQLRQLREKREARLGELRSRVVDLDEKARLLQPDSEEARKTLRLLEEAKREYRTYREATEDSLYDKLFDFTRRIYKKIRDEVQAYAREAGYDLVLRIRDPEIGGFDESLRPRMRYLELNRRIEYQDVLFHKTAFDFTHVIIKRVNQRYARERAEKRKHEPPKPTKPATGKEKEQ